MKKEKIMKKSKTIDYLLGFISGVCIMIAIWGCSSPLKATDYGERGQSRYSPLFVTIVEE